MIQIGIHSNSCFGTVALVALGGALLACGDAAAPSAEPAPETEFDAIDASAQDLTLGGSSTPWTVFADPYGDGRPNPLVGLTGRVSLTVAPDRNESRMTLRVFNAPAKTTFGAHAHAGTCADNKGAGHYQQMGTAPTAQNEVWLDFTTNKRGSGFAQATQPFVVRPKDIKSVVIHANATDPATGKAGAKLACIDIGYYVTFLEGSSWTVFPNPPEVTTPNPAAKIAGDALVVSFDAKADGQSSFIGLSVTGLEKNRTFGAHVHSKPCEDTQGGGHYQHEGTTVSADNEVWLDFTTNRRGEAYVGVTKKVALRPDDAKSIVVHTQATDPQTGKAGTKLACLNLVPLAPCENHGGHVH